MYTPVKTPKAVYFRFSLAFLKYTGSRPITEVKLHRACLVLGWVTARESQVPNTFLFIFSFFLQFEKTKDLFQMKLKNAKRRRHCMGYNTAPTRQMRAIASVYTLQLATCQDWQPPSAVYTRLGI